MVVLGNCFGNDFKRAKHYPIFAAMMLDNFLSFLSSLYHRFR